MHCFPPLPCLMLLPPLLLASTTVMYYCWVHKRLRLTNYSIPWMWLHVLLVIQESSIAVSGNLCMSTFNGSTCRNERSSSLCRWCIHRPSSQGSSVLDGLLHSNLWCGQSMTTSFCQASLPRCALTQSQLVWALGICCCRPNCLELTDPTLSTDSFSFGCFHSTAH